MTSQEITAKLIEVHCETTIAIHFWAEVDNYHNQREVHKGSAWQQRRQVTEGRGGLVGHENVGHE